MGGWLMYAQAAPGRWTPGRIVVWAVVAAIIYGLYRLNVSRRRSADEAYWRARKREDELRRNDPDMAGEDPPGGPLDSGS